MLFDITLEVNKVINICYFLFLNSGFSPTYTTGNNGIIANYVFPYIWRSLLYLHNMMLVNVKLDFKITVFASISNDTTKMKLAILAFLYCREFVKNLLV